MSRFYFQWYGNKLLELHRVDAVVDWTRFDTIVEPFCGSAALSLERYAKGYRGNIVLNDIDPRLVAMLNHIKAEGSSDGLYQYCRERQSIADWKAHQRLKSLKAEATPEEYFYYSRMRGDFGRAGQQPSRWPSLVRGPRQQLTGECLASPSTTITLGDWRECVDKYKDDSRTLIFFDPPYFASWNQEYYSHGGGVLTRDADGFTHDGTHIFVEMLEHMDTAAATIVAIKNDCSILEHLFRSHIRERYAKTYANVFASGGQYQRRKAYHILTVGGGRDSQ